MEYIVHGSKNPNDRNFKLTLEQSFKLRYKVSLKLVSTIHWQSQNRKQNSYIARQTTKHAYNSFKTESFDFAFLSGVQNLTI